MKISENNSTENCIFYRHEKSLYIAWACFRNGSTICAIGTGVPNFDSFFLPLRLNPRRDIRGVFRYTKW